MILLFCVTLYMSLIGLSKYFLLFYSIAIPIWLHISTFITFIGSVALNTIIFI